MAAILADYLAASTAQPHVWGQSDCTLWVANWVLLKTGYDPAASYRGVYSTAEEARAFIKQAGGLVPVVAEFMDVRFARTDTPRAGDVGVVDVQIRCDLGLPVLGAISAICGNGLWHTRMHRGVRGDAWPVIAAWKL